jgi:uncharacterized membrane protein
MQQWSLDPVFDSYTVVFTTVVLLLCTFLLVRPRNNLSAARTRVLLILRCLIVLILALAMLRPSKTISELQTKQALVMFLVDETQSMSQPSMEPEISRWEHQQVTWDSVHRVLDARADDVSARLFGYSDTITENRLGSAGGSFPVEPLGLQTDLGTSLYEAVMTEPGRQIHAVVLMGDGTQTSYQPQVDMREAISVLRNMGIALITVPFGREGDTLQARDVSIEQLPQQYRVFSGNDVSIDCLARLKGVANRPLRVQLLLKSEDEKIVVQETVEIVADNADAIVPVRFQWTAKAPGQYQMAVKVEAVDGELLLQNNTQTAFLTVLEGGLRVLYFYGNRLGEQLELRRSLGSSPDIELLEVYIRHGKNSQWPDPRTSAVLDGDFDLIIIEDVHSRAFGQANLQAIADAVEQGKGLMMVGGYYSFGPGGYRRTPMNAALPIEMEIFEKQEIGVENPVRKMFHLDRELAMQPTGNHPVTSISSVPTAWNDLPVLLGANRFQGVKSFGKVLLETVKQEPLLVSGQYGLGRVLAFAGDSTWRWARMGHAVELRRFWRNSVLWLARREDLQQQDIWLRMDQRRITPGVELSFELGVDSLGSRVVTADDMRWEVKLVRSEDEAKVVQVSRQNQQWVGMLSNLQQPGDYKLSATAFVNNEVLGIAQAAFQVIDVQPEKSNPIADITQLKRLAAMTVSDGGAMVAPEKLAEHVGDIIDNAQQLEVEVQVTWQFGRSSGSAWLILTIISSLFTLEWFLRKKFGLV